MFDDGWMGTPGNVVMTKYLCVLCCLGAVMLPLAAQCGSAQAQSAASPGDPAHGVPDVLGFPQSRKVDGLTLILFLLPAVCGGLVRSARADRTLDRHRDCPGGHLPHPAELPLVRRHPGQGRGVDADHGRLHLPPVLRVLLQPGARTGVGTETSRAYDEDSNRSKMERTTQRGDESVSTERKVDYDNRTVDTNRQTSQGGSSSVKRETSGGTISSSGTVTTGDGRSYAVDGSTTRTGGSTTVTGEQGSANIDTKRQGGQSVSSIEGSGGGQGASMSGQGAGRTTIGQTGSGDIYAGHDGNVYKKTDSGLAELFERGLAAGRCAGPRAGSYGDHVPTLWHVDDGSAGIAL